MRDRAGWAAQVHPQHVVMAAASGGKDVECPRYTLMLDAPDLAAALMRQMPPSASVTRQFVTSCEALKRKRYTCKIELEREWDQPVHRKVAREALFDYYHQLASPPLSTVNFAQLGLSFVWRDSIAFRSRGVKDRSGVIERCNVIYNIGCASAGLGSDTLKLSSRPERAPLAKRHFEDAAGAFAEVRRVLQEDEMQRWRDDKKVNLELQPQALDALIHCMLAYAARCFYEKALEDGRKPKLLAQLAVRVSAGYNAAGGRMEEAVLARRGMDKFLGQWADYIKLETDFFLAQAHSHMAEEDASTFRAAHQRLHLQEACAVLNRVFAASNASKGGGKLLKLHRPNLLASVTALKTKLARLTREIDQLIYGADALEPPPPAEVRLPEGAPIKVEPQDFAAAVQESRQRVPLLFESVVFDTAGARRDHSQHPVAVSDDTDSEEEATSTAPAAAGAALGGGVNARAFFEHGDFAPGDLEENDMGARARQDFAQPVVEVGEPLAPGAPHATSCPSPRLPHHLAAPRATAVAAPSGTRVGEEGRVSESLVGRARAGRESSVRSSWSNVKGAVVDDELDDPAASSEAILRRAREAREDRVRQVREESERRQEEERQRQQDWQQEQRQRQQRLARDRPVPQPEASLSPQREQSGIGNAGSGADSPPTQPSLAAAVEASLSSSLSPQQADVWQGAGVGHRLGGAEGGGDSRSDLPLSHANSREPPSTPAASATRRRALEAAEARQREAATAAAGVSRESGEGGEGMAGGGGERGGPEQAVGGLGLRVGDVAAPGYLFGGVHEGLPFYVCVATGVSMWELPPTQHLAAVALAQGELGAASQLRPGDPMPGHPDFVFGGYANGLPFYHDNSTGQSVWELPPTDAGSAVREEEAPNAGNGEPAGRRGSGGEADVVRGSSALGASQATIRGSGHRVSAAGSADRPAAMDMSGEDEVRAALAARAPRRMGANEGGVAGGGGRAGRGEEAGGGGGRAPEALAGEGTQEEQDRALALRMAAEFEEEEAAQARRLAAHERDSAADPAAEDARAGSASARAHAEEGGGESEVEAEEQARRLQEEHERELRVQQQEQTALEEHLRRVASGRTHAQEAAARRAGADASDASAGLGETEEERRATDLLRKEELLRSRERELARKMKELESKEREAARQREQDQAQREREGERRRGASGAEPAVSTGKERDDDVPNEYLCPITMDIMSDPVIAMDGMSYERKVLAHTHVHKRRRMHARTHARTHAH